MKVAVGPGRSVLQHILCPAKEQGQINEQLRTKRLFGGAHPFLDFSY